MRRERRFSEGRLAWTAVLISMALGVAGYFGAWIGHRGAGLVVTGLDLAEYVKFVSGGVPGGLFGKREIFYLPLFAGSVIASLAAGRRCLPAWLRVVASVGAFVLALCMLPPAWTPSLLQQTEYRLQAIAIAACLLILLVSLLARPVADSALLPGVGVLALLAALWSPAYFLRVLEPISKLYGTQLRPAWGWWLCAGAFAILTCAVLAYAVTASRRRLEVGADRESRQEV